MKIKHILIDLGLVILILFMGSSYFSHYSIAELTTQRQVTAFEKDLQKEITNQTRYYDTEENGLCAVFKNISDIVVSIIEYIVLIFSNIISSLF